MLVPRTVALRGAARRIVAAGRCLRFAVALAVALGAAPAALRAQEAVERPEPFDSAGRVRVITPTAAARLMLGPPAWRITGDYREARLYSSAEGYVIAVTRRDGTIE